MDGKGNELHTFSRKDAGHFYRSETGENEHNIRKGHQETKRHIIADFVQSKNRRRIRKFCFFEFEERNEVEDGTE